jgi:hypothetical protein
MNKIISPSSGSYSSFFKDLTESNVIPVPYFDVELLEIDLPPSSEPEPPAFFFFILIKFPKSSASLLEFKNPLKLFYLLPLLVKSIPFFFTHHPILFHTDRETLLESTLLTRFPRILRDVTASFV